jgi:hypothetical protein
MLGHFWAPKTATAVLSALNILAGPGVLRGLDGALLLGSDVLQAGDYLYQRQGESGR